MNSASNTHPLSGGWRIVPLVTMIGITVLMCVSWLTPAFRASWDALDLVVFRSLNNTLSSGQHWRNLWAFMNWRGFDVVSGILLLMLVASAHREIGVTRWRSSITSLVLLAFAILATRQFVSETLIDKTIHYHRPSPTHILDGTWRLGNLVPTIHAKDSSPWSFPGDHGFVVFSIALYVNFLRARRTAPWAWLLAAILVLPRLVGGAHWLTDILIGSGSMALVSISLLMATPVHDVFLKMLCGDFFEIREPNPHGEAAARTPSTNESEPLRRAA